ncbi:hypothetical protein D9M71_642610 [compost metagenome]
MLADIAQRGRAQQRIAQRVQQHVAVGMGDQPELVGNAHAAQGDEIALAEAVYVVTVANSHDQKNALNNQGVILPALRRLGPSGPRRDASGGRR